MFDDIYDMQDKRYLLQFQKGILRKVLVQQFHSCFIFGSIQKTFLFMRNSTVLERSGPSLIDLFMKGLHYLGHGNWILKWLKRLHYNI